jgi:decaprenylphospho-beta-D-erythro-pentofuranosid-2-ulose 2-reductase
MTRAIIFGATSAIAAAYARELAAGGADIVLAARSPARLGALADDLKVRGARAVHTIVFDATRVEEFPAALDAGWRHLERVDVALIAFGTLSNQERCSSDPAELLRELQTNVIGTLPLAEQLAGRLERQRAGTLVVISSVAGDRGRASNYAYGAAKAALSEFASGLRQRLHGTGVNVLTVKPGFVDTPMTAQFPKGALWAKPEDVARDIAKAVAKRRAVLYTPWFWWIIMTVIRALPEKLFVRFAPR